MNKINQIQDKQTQDFARACYDQNTISELQARLNVIRPDVADMKTWGITSHQWKEAITAALADRQYCYDLIIDKARHNIYTESIF